MIIKRSIFLLLLMSTLFIGVVTLLLSTLQKYGQLSFMHFYSVCHQAATSLFSTSIHFIGFGASLGVIIIGLLLVVRVIFSFVKTQRKLRRLQLDRTATEPNKLLQVRQILDIEKGTTVSFLSEKEIVFTGGLLFSKIYISSSLINNLSHKELEAVLIHERYHLDQKHSLWLFCADIIFSTFIFIPLFKLLFYTLKAQFEKEADSAVIHVQRSVEYLQRALAVVTGESLVVYYPAFYSRRVYTVSMHHIAASVLSIFILLALLLIPFETQAVSTETAVICGKNQCSINCVTDARSKMSTTPEISFQNKLFSPSGK